MHKTKEQELHEVAAWLGTQPGMRFDPAGFGSGIVTLDAGESDADTARPDEIEHSVVATISTRGKDRVGDIVEPAGASIAAFRRNPVVLFAHKYDEPAVARSLWERIDGDRLIAKPRFHLKTQLSRELWELYRDGDMKAWSIGFIPTEFEEVEKDDADGPVGYYISEWELLEYSAVPVPANADAVTNILRAGRVSAPVLVKSLTAWLSDRRNTSAPSAKLDTAGIVSALADMKARAERIEALLNEQNDALLAELERREDAADAKEEPVEMSMADLSDRLGEVGRGAIRKLKGKLD